VTCLRRNFVACLIFVALPGVLRPQTLSFINRGPEPDAALARDMLAAHNDVRARADVPPLRWSARLAQVAQEWANHLMEDGQFYHRPKAAFGENLFEISGSRALPAEVVGVWAAEAQDYSYSANTCRDICGHYTQLVWSDTREVGCAVARDAMREVWVCNYDPRGNWVGERPY
jgi:pathogenesis-related protein 1